ALKRHVGSAQEGSALPAFTNRFVSSAPPWLRKSGAASSSSALRRDRLAAGRQGLPRPGPAPPSNRPIPSGLRPDGSYPSNPHFKCHLGEKKPVLVIHIKDLIHIITKFSSFASDERLLLSCDVK
ncbi:hypothetical protein ZEAMMB73_Zm00001d047366, partial [Zea mays]